MTDEAREALEDITRAVVEASQVTTGVQRLGHLLALAKAELDVLGGDGYEEARTEIPGLWPIVPPDVDFGEE